MMYKYSYLVFALLFLFLSSSMMAQQMVTLDYYLPQNISYDENIPTPKEVLGYEVGEWHISHDQLVYYMRTLASASDRITIETYARSYEQRPLLMLTITSPNNHKNISSIIHQHAKLMDANASQDLNTAKMPAVLYQGYSVHGNESSGANAAVLYAYYLAAAKGKAIEDKLANTVILLDPCFNPDGLNRFANWVNMHKSYTTIGDPNEREFNEVWPRGRTNHYWFDLNRDWLLVQHPESQGRIRNFHKWKPNILTDHHEMGTNSTFFFQPGVPSRTHPITPPKNQALTGKIAAFHAKFLDEIGSLYFTKERFDDFYYGKGSTYPDVNGGIGILFEQASSRGHAQESVNGILTFPFTIRNQFATSLSTLEAGYTMREELLNWQREFYQTAAQSAQQEKAKAYVFGDANDPARTARLVELLLRHGIQIYQLGKDVNLSNVQFKQSSAYAIPTHQPQYRLIKAIFEQRTSFSDSLFYDVSGFNLALAFNMPYAASSIPVELGDQITEMPSAEQQVQGEQSQYAYLMRWNGYYAPRALYAILDQGLMAKVAEEPLKIAGQNFKEGTILIPVERQPLTSDAIYQLMQRLAKEDGVQIVATQTGLSDMGITLGSPGWSNLKRPNTAVVVEGGASGYDAGEVWHLFDQRYRMPISKIAEKTLQRADLDRYNTIVLVNGNYEKETASKLKKWVQAGNTLILYRGAINWAARYKLAQVEFVQRAQAQQAASRPYNKIAADRGRNVIGGAIFETTGDLSHPMLYGYDRPLLPVFHRGTTFLKPTKNPYATPLVYTENPLLNGYISNENLKAISNSAAVIVNRTGGGRVICLADNTNFRAFWYGTNRLLMNAVFFGHTISYAAAVPISD